MELYDKIHENEELKTYILAGNRVLGELGFTGSSTLDPAMLGQALARWPSHSLVLVPELLRLLLEKQVVRGSTGAITLLDGAISFFPNGSDRASACRPLTYEKKHR